MAMLWGEITYYSNKNDNENENENNPIINDHKQTIYIKFFHFFGIINKKGNTNQQ